MRRFDTACARCSSSWASETNRARFIPSLECSQSSQTAALQSMHAAYRSCAYILLDDRSIGQHRMALRLQPRGQQLCTSALSLHVRACTHCQHASGQPGMFNAPKLRHVCGFMSHHLQECVERMMTWDARKRPSAREMLQHPWIRKDGVAGSNIIEPEVIRRLKAFANMNAFKKHTLTVSDCFLVRGASLGYGTIRGVGVPVVLCRVVLPTYMAVAAAGASCVSVHCSVTSAELHGSYVLARLV